MGEWAQLRANPNTRTGLERGVWYKVEARGADGLISVLVSDAVALPIPANLIRLLDREPDAVTRVQQSEFHPVRPGEPSPTPEYYGVCPQGHWIRDIPESQPEVQCRRCGRAYRVENEA